MGFQIITRAITLTMFKDSNVILYQRGRKLNFSYDISSLFEKVKKYQAHLANI